MSLAIPVAPLPSIAGRDWDSRRRSFRGRPCLDLGQPWRRNPESLLSLGQVRLGLSGMSLALFAILRDRDVFNPVEHFNVPAFPHGDVLEIFAQPEGQAAYYEFHITPSGALCQLRWPGPMRDIPLDWDGPADPLLPYKISRWRCRAQARVTRQGWEVHAEIPLKRVFEETAPWDGSRIRINVGRYDYTRGRLKPVLSATAPLCERDFHRSHEWQLLELRFR